MNIHKEVHRYPDLKYNLYLVQLSKDILQVVLRSQFLAWLSDSTPSRL